MAIAIAVSVLLLMSDARDIYPNNKIAMSGIIDPLIVLAFSFKAKWIIYNIRRSLFDSIVFLYIAFSM